MRVIIVGLVLLEIMNLTSGTCVLESEFGFILNCNFKKSGLFRVRNLGGLKAHFGLGFSLGDELGFGESLGNLEGNRRRALNYKTGFVNKVGVIATKNDSSAIGSPYFNHIRNVNQNTSSMTEVMFLPLGVPTFKPIPKIVNNLVRRKDIVLSDETENFHQIPDNVKANITHFSSPINVKSSLIKENIYNELKNVSNSIQNTGSSILLNEMNEKNGMQKIRGDEFNSKKLTTKTQTTKINLAIAKKTSSSSSVKSSKAMLVMNAPKEYYPSGYDKNFDDNFKSKVDLPQTHFACAEQKYFPGLYANIDLGCMVFHVCAITDAGIVMKSFLCPESTLFDQSILKCNWWFYVDCTNSIYDSNIPFSKSYQLMKSLSYFSNFTKNQGTEN